MGDDSSDIQVGSLIALLAESGEDWKAIQSSQPSKTSTGIQQQPTKSKDPVESLPHKELHLNKKST